MATSKSKEGGVNIRYDAFIKQVRPDASNTDPVAILHGYIGESGSDDKIRLYADESLSEYADILKTDILYAVPDEENPLGGSRLWVKQSAEVNHTDANAFAQGDMYNAYMGNMYEGGAANMGGAAAAATALCTAPLTRTIICRPTRFVCPTPASRLIICNRITQTGPGCQLVSFGPACPKPSWVDGCPSALGCTIGTTVINPGRGAGFANAAGGYGDYTGGDMYNDYMANSYDAGGATGEFGGAATTTVCAASIPAWRCPPVLHTLNIVRCGFSYQVDCLRPSVLSFCVTQQRNVCSRHICNQQACQLGSIRVPIQSIACATDITRPATNVVNPGAGFADAAGGYGDYTGGDMYNEYMANSYDAGATGEFGGGLTNPAICNNPVSLTIICNKPSLLTQCRSLQILCITRNTPHCPIGCQFGSIRVPIKTLACATDFTRPVFNTTRQAGPVQSVDYCRTDLCPSNFCPDRAINPAVNPGVVGGFADAYGGYGDYSGGDMYNDYMANSYDAGATGEFGGGAITQACTIQPTTPVICQQTIVCPASVPVWRCPINTLPPRCPVYSLPPRCPIFTRPPRCP
ncbi:MAG: hypothetical protein JNM68_04625, partial [Dinghuibacter sp.]|nr:hypothetical protein [Dinghuibacter sp.]